MIGVNLGGWLIPERWMTPQLFEGTDAGDLMGLLVLPGGHDRYVRHLETFITEEDFRWLAEHGVSMVRLPVGWWALDGDGVLPATRAQLDWAMAMASKYNMKVLIDMHALPGSQNGEHHSGKAGKVGWRATRAQQDEAIEYLVAVVERFHGNSSFWGIELVNEPKLGKRYFPLLWFYRRAYKRLRSALPDGAYTVFHDAFHPLLFSGALVSRKNYPVVLDMHLYGFSQKSYSYIQRYAPRLIRWCQLRQPVIIGEWSGVVPRDEPTGAVARYIALQQKSYKHVLATCFWSYKTADETMWNFRALVEKGVIDTDK